MAKKGLIIALLLSLFGIKSVAQEGDLMVGALGVYSNYSKMSGGLTIDYNLRDHFQFSLSQAFGGYEDEYKGISNKVRVFTTNLDARFLIIHQREWGMGPFIGAQYMIEKSKDKAHDYLNDNRPGFNIGWHMQGNLTDFIRVSGGWRWSNLTEGTSHHQFYLSLGYNFSLF